MILILALTLHAWYKPFSSSELNRLELSTLLASCVVLVAALGVFLKSSNQVVSDVFIQFVFLFVVTISACVLMWCIFFALKHRRPQEIAKVKMELEEELEQVLDEWVDYY